MELTEILTFAMATIVAMLGFYMKQLAVELREMRRDHNKCKEELPLRFMLKVDYHDEQKQFRGDIKEDIADLKVLIQSLFDKMERERRE